MIETEELLAVVTRLAAWEWMQRRYLQSGPVCPSCQSPITGTRALAAWQDLRKVYCAGCGHTFRPTSGTPIHETSWQPEELVKLLLLVEAGRTTAQMAASLSKSSGCIRDMLERIRIWDAAGLEGHTASSDQLRTAQG